jgi:hypothetical protein
VLFVCLSPASGSNFHYRISKCFRIFRASRISSRRRKGAEIRTSLTSPLHCLGVNQICGCSNFKLSLWSFEHLLSAKWRMRFSQATMRPKTLWHIYGGCRRKSTPWTTFFAMRTPSKSTIRSHDRRYCFRYDSVPIRVFLLVTVVQQATTFAGAIHPNGRSSSALVHVRADRVWLVSHGTRQVEYRTRLRDVTLVYGRESHKHRRFVDDFAEPMFSSISSGESCATISITTSC